MKPELRAMMRGISGPALDEDATPSVVMTLDLVEGLPSHSIFASLLSSFGCRLDAMIREKDVKKEGSSSSVAARFCTMSKHIQCPTYLLLSPSSHCWIELAEMTDDQRWTHP
jgi:hypothetical protein